MTPTSTRKDLRTREHASIRDFVQKAADHGYLDGAVLDYGSGRQPYRDIIETRSGDAGEYVPYDSPLHPASCADEDTTALARHRRFDAILCTQVVQYVEDVPFFLESLRGRLLRHGLLVLTYPTNWPEVEPEDLHRFTKAGMDRLLAAAGFEVIWNTCRASVVLSSGEQMALGYGAVARA